jgi:hypothetical protein
MPQQSPTLRLRNWLEEKDKIVETAMAGEELTHCPFLEL